MILDFFAPSSDHPLADAKELKRVVAELPKDPFKAVDEIVGWFESLQHAEKFRADRLNEVVRHLDEIAQPHMRRLLRDYLMSPRLSKMDERRWWTASVDFWHRLGVLYEMALVAASNKDKVADALKPHLPLIASRLIQAIASEFKWTHFRYGPVHSNVWARMGSAYRVAEQGKYAGKALQLYPGIQGATTPAQEYLKAIVLAASSLDSLLPVEIELAEKLIGHFLPLFVLTDKDRPDNLYWIDPATGQAPQRLARVPQHTATLRFVSPGKAPVELAAMIDIVARGELPADVALGGQYSARAVHAVLRHIANYWSARPPLRKHQRHPVKSRLAVMHGFDTCAIMFNGSPGTLGDVAESWVVDNVSVGGFGAVVPIGREEWLRIGALLCLQPEGGDNWLLGVVRRYGKDNDTQAGVGIQTIARSARTVKLRPRGAASYAAAGIKGIVFQEDAEDGDELCLVLPAHTFDVREKLDATIDGQMTMLAPVELLESGPDYEVARYRTKTT